MIDEIVEPVVFDDGYWDEALVFARHEVQKHVDAGYTLKRYIESYDAMGKEHLFAELAGEDSTVYIFASPEDGLVVSRVPAIRALAVARTTRRMKQQ
jgi:hypothetical protein